MRSRLKRRIALLVVALLAFAQINVAFASCSMDRGMLGSMATMEANEPCGGCDTPPLNSQNQLPSLCVAHCTSDLQLAVVSIAIVRAPSQSAILIVPPRIWAAPPTGLDGPPSGAPPRRILLHSFLI
jgi:hypothetical protein